MTIKTSTTTMRSGNPGCLLLFALPFAAFGLFMVGMTVWTTWRYLEASSWPEVPAQIQELQLAYSKSGKRGTVRVAGRYTYEFGGTAYTSERISIGVGSDNIGSFHKDLYEHLHAKQQKAEPIFCYVNPAHPEDSLLNRDLRLGMLALYASMGLLFGGAGSLFIYLGIGSQLRKRKIARIEAQYPGQPWKIRSDWAQGYIRSNAANRARLAAFLSVMILLLTLPVVLAIPDAVLVKKKYVALLGLLFPAIGVAVGVWAVRAMAIWKRFGKTRLKIDPFPIRPGQTIRATLALEEAIQPIDGEIRGTLSCTTVKTNRFRGRSESRVVSLHNENVPGKLQPASAGSMLTFSFTQPKTLPTCDVSEKDEPITWTFSVQVRLPGADLSVSYDLPVYR